MIAFDVLEQQWQALPPPRKGSGTLHLIVRRLGDGKHETPARVALSPAGGLQGDRWALAPNRSDEAHVSFIDRRVALLLTGGDPERAHLPGDNFQVDLDLSEAALPVGTTLRVGTALVEITAKPHAGCATFKARLGDDALRWVNEKDRRSRRLRGVFGRVVEAGEVAVGDPIVCTP